jgi:DNA-binding winged helix-turn-helix (wHTH) protein
MITDAAKTFKFGRFRLVIRPHPTVRNRVRLALFHDDDDEPVHAEPQQLELLRLFLEHYPDEVVTAETIADTLWPHSFNGINLVQKQMTELRRILGDNFRDPLYIRTVRDGYKFIAAVEAEGDLGRIDGLLKWSTELLHKRLHQLRRNDNDPEDLRIVTGGLVPHKQVFDFEDCFRLGLRVRIVMTNPENKLLLKARHDLRLDKYTAEKAQADIREEIDYLTLMMSRFPADILQVRLSNVIPSLIVHSRPWALLGIFPAQGSYSLGPMVDTTYGTSLWKALYDDWKTRWDKAADIGPGQGVVASA